MNDKLDQIIEVCTVLSEGETKGVAFSAAKQWLHKLVDELKEEENAPASKTE